MRNPSEHFATAIDRAASRLAGVDEAAASSRVDGGWSAKQIVGHLIDSASNNHGRFVRAQGRDDLAFEGYDGDQWVDAQRYMIEDYVAHLESHVRQILPDYEPAPE